MVSVMTMNGINAFAASAVPEQYMCIFDAGYYAARYPDLAAVFGSDEAALFNHFVSCGMAEGRQGSAEFDVNFYRAAYPDLAAVFGNDLPAYYSHYAAAGRAEGRVGAGTAPVASQTPAAAGLPAASGLSDAAVGSIITFGSYEQDNNLINGKEPIEWYVLDKSDGQMLLVAVKVLDNKPYGVYSGDGVSWETSTLRSWLNNDFYNAAFSAAEKALITDSYVVNSNNPHRGTDAGNDTIDKVFCLGFEELETYFHIDCRNNATMAWEDYCLYCYNQDHRILAAPTDYAHANTAFLLTPTGAWFYSWDVNYAVGSSPWWLRSPGYDVTYAARVDVCGGADTLGRTVSYDGLGVRPALRVIY
ncbi:MAG: DUF6273 domain-containing protein [bacterium]|nr:DUF6273 domain-containing protein [bacterium]